MKVYPSPLHTVQGHFVSLWLLHNVANTIPALSPVRSGAKGVLVAPCHPADLKKRLVDQSPHREYCTHLHQMCPPITTCGREAVQDLEDLAPEENHLITQKADTMW